MDTNFAAITIFTLLFAVCTARISLDPKPHCKVDKSNLGFVPSGMKKPGSNGPENVLESGNDQTVRVDSAPRSDYARFHAINHRFFDESRVPIHSVHNHPHRQFQRPSITRSKMSHENGVFLTHENGNVRAEKFHRSNRLKFEHDQHHQYQYQYQHQHHHHEQDHHHIHKGNNEVSMPKHKFVREKVVHQHKVETREQEPGFMKSIRKFLKHTFD